MQVKFYTVKNRMNLSPVLHQKSLNNRKNTDFDYIVSVRFFFFQGDSFRQKYILICPLVRSRSKS